MMLMIDVYWPMSCHRMNSTPVSQYSTMTNKTIAIRSNKRRHLRYSIDPDHNVRAEFKRLGYESRWRPVLIADESYSGCRIIVIDPECGEAGDILKLDLGNKPLEVEIMRVEIIAPKVHSLGCRFVL